jgi:hypothetical protein
MTGEMAPSWTCRKVDGLVRREVVRRATSGRLLPGAIPQLFAVRPVWGAWVDAGMTDPLRIRTGQWRVDR